MNISPLEIESAITSNRQIDDVEQTRLSTAQSQQCDDDPGDERPPRHDLNRKRYVSSHATRRLAQGPFPPLAIPSITPSGSNESAIVHNRRSVVNFSLRSRDSAGWNVVQ
ncbi:MAG: hypothetical protein HC869_15685 [Rhodospirillales bacterium]|nr:hypothetical protein [Rhodospirillales bacterium]